MPEDLKTITLPEREDMLRRLMSVSDERHLVEQFYPRVLESAGNERNGMGVVMMLQLAIYDYVKGYPPSIIILLEMMVDDYLTALIDDEEVRNDALNMMRDVRTDSAVLFSRFRG